MQSSCNTQSPFCHLFVPILLSVDSSCEIPLGEAIAAHLAKLALSIAEGPGLIWKIWTENAQESTVGGYLVGMKFREALASRSAKKG